MIVVELYSKRECHLCDIAKENLQKAQRIYPFELRVTNIQEGTGHFERFKEEIPVVFINKELAFRHHAPVDELLVRLRATSAAAR